MKLRLVLLALALLPTAGCPRARVERPYPPPAPLEILEHVQSVRKRASSLKAETKTDVRLGGERVNVDVWMITMWGGKMRFQAFDPNNSTAADLASDGTRYCSVDMHANCGQCGEATPHSVARLIRIPLQPDEVMAILLGSTPVLAGEATLAWDGAEEREVLTIKGEGGWTQKITLDAKDKRWDVLESEQIGPDGKAAWKIRHKDFREVKTVEGGAIRLPTTSLFEQTGDTVLIQWKKQEIGVKLPDTAFTLALPAGLAECRAR